MSKILTISPVFLILHLMVAWPAYALTRYYSIQFGSYKNLDNAVEEVSRLARSGHNAFLRHETIIGNGKWFRVYIDRHGSKGEAEKEAKKLRQTGLISSYYLRAIDGANQTGSRDAIHDGTDFYLHLNSFVQKINADKEVQRLRKHGYNTSLAAVEIPEGKWFKVFMGTFDDEQEAIRVGSELKEKGIVSYFRLRKIDGVNLSGKKKQEKAKENITPKVVASKNRGSKYSFQKLEFEDSGKGRAYYDFGVFAYEDGDYEDAEKNFEKALKSNPDNPFYNHYMGRTYLKLKGYQEAENYLNKAWAIQPGMPDLKYDIALVNYKMTNYSKAADLFSEIVKEDPSNVLANYHAGISLYKQKRYGEALKYFDRVAEMSPNIKANGYYYAGISHLKMGYVERAVEKLEYVRDHAESESLREHALKWLGAIEKQKKALKPYSLYLKIGYQYDDNVRLEPLEQDIFVDEADSVIEAYFSGSYSLVNREDYKIGVAYSHYQTWHLDLGEYDLVGSIFSLYGKYRLPPFTFGFSYLPSYYWLESDSFLMRHQLRPEVSWKVSKNLVTQLAYSYYRNNNFQDNDRDGHTNELSLNAYYSIGEKRGHLFGGIGYEDNTASHPDQYYDQLKTKLGISLNVPWGLHLGLTGKFYEQNYDNVNSTFGIKREDAKYSGSISLSRNVFYDWLSASGDFSYSKNDSNIEDYKYKRRVTTLSLTGRY